MKSLSRALMVLNELSRCGRPLTLSDIAGAVDLHKSTVHRMLATFVEHGLVRRDEANRYVVGLGALELARAAQGQAGPGPLVEATLSKLRDSTGLAAVYAQPRGGQLICTALAERRRGIDPSVVRPGAMPARPPAPTTLSMHIAFPMHATAVGKAYLAHRPRAEVDRFTSRAPFPGYTPRTITDAYALLRSLARTRDRGFAVDDREYAVDLRSISAPVLDHDGLAIAAVGVAAPARLSRPDDLRRFAAAVTAGADELGEGLLHGARTDALAGRSA
ncbi:IclR family transcriptional regulator [Phytoactinopolyspora halotolerans]|uniref:Glycerol operon regulatory protein n=1 Tax=Phytoactinopolyspora halotolerans TaxID=1981512 RepID=A0A6L9SI41_9ACTN|nr:IclR family transcriptional regulator [Phytoactinopolyspora halotolerans]NEE04304.1 IclR family transcriptional regulator [Phytoactinopolyspora halotolerans]